MLTVEVMTTFIAATALLGLAPGPDILFVLSQSAIHGRTAGFSVIFGLCTGCIVHTMAVALGVAVIFKTSIVAFTVLKFFGAGYLVYLAWQAFKASSTTLSLGAGNEVSRWKLYCRGILMNISNPKVSIFFLAFLPQFADPARGPVFTQIMMLGGLFIVTSIFVFGSVAMLAGCLGQWLARSERAQVILNRLAGTVFAVLALKLATAEQ